KSDVGAEVGPYEAHSRLVVAMCAVLTAASLDRVIGLVRIRAKQRAPELARRSAASAAPPTRPHHPHPANQFFRGSRPSLCSLLELSSVMNHEWSHYIQWNISRPDSKDDRSSNPQSFCSAQERG